MSEADQRQQPDGAKQAGDHPSRHRRMIDELRPDQCSEPDDEKKVGCAEHVKPDDRHFTFYVVRSGP